MARFYGAVGYGKTVKTAPGVHQDTITERNYTGDVFKTSYKVMAGDQINSSLSIGNTISIVADAYADTHFFAIRYVEWAGARWTVTNVEVQPPRLLLRLGGVYNGPTG